MNVHLIRPEQAAEKTARQDAHFKALGIPVGSEEFQQAFERFAALRQQFPDSNPVEIFCCVLRAMQEEGLIKPQEKNQEDETTGLLKQLINKLRKQ